MDKKGNKIPLHVYHNFKAISQLGFLKKALKYESLYEVAEMTKHGTNFKELILQLKLHDRHGPNVELNIRICELRSL